MALAELFPFPVQFLPLLSHHLCRFSSCILLYRMKEQPRLSVRPVPLSFEVPKGCPCLGIKRQAPIFSSSPFLINSSPTPVSHFVFCNRIKEQPHLSVRPVHFLAIEVPKDCPRLGLHVICPAPSGARWPTWSLVGSLSFEDWWLYVGEIS